MSDRSEQRSGPHQGQPVLAAGVPLAEAQAAMIMVHGRGASAEDILGLVDEIDHPGFAYLAPQAANHTWYPYRFLAPIEQNEPYLSSALDVIGGLLHEISAAGIPPERVILLGFSQGACLAIEFAARNARRYGGVAVLSGGVIGPEGAPRDYSGSFDSTPILLGCSDIDPHIPLHRVQETTQIVQRMGANATERIYPGMGHTVNDDEIQFVQQMMAGLLSM